MLTLFPSFNYTDDTILFIIGNGFDLAHRMPTQYSDFRSWLELNEEDNLIHKIENYFNIKPDTWCDFEHALGEYDLHALYDYCTEGLEIDYDHMMRSVYLIEDSPDIYVEAIRSDIANAFERWVSIIETPPYPLSLGLGKNCKYLTFNYTETLEETYQIPSENIRHIHGRVKKYEDPIFGHNNFQYDTNAIEYAQWQFEESAKSKIIGIMNQLHKNTSGCIANHKDFFDSLSDIENVIILGHSYSDIDYPYFSKVKDSIMPTAFWTLCAYSHKDVIAANTLLDIIDIPNENYQIVKNEDL